MSEGIDKGLWEKLKKKFTIGINYSYHFFNSTCQVWLDNKFYKENQKDLDKLPLIITKPDKKLPSNTIQLKPMSTYHRDVKRGCYKGSLSGIYSLSLAIYLLDVGEIFLLGYDFGEDKRKEMKKPGSILALTHFYQGKINHGGVGKINYYNTKKRAREDFAPFAKEKKVKIYNVSFISNIPNEVIQKISYDQFFEKLDKNQFNQEELRKYIKGKLK